jgi:Spy/CpxP family protein refolding chaperone
MNRLAIVVVIALALTPQLASALAQQPYAGFEMRPIKALSDEQLGNLKAGRGMGLALAAELNGYPGPIHVFELADSLQLSETQRIKVQQLLEAMKAETIPLGEMRIAQETDLDRQFANRTVTEASLAAATHAIGTTQAALRAAHLKYHLATVEVLAPEQIVRYSELRGYVNGAHAGDLQSTHRH